MTIVRQTFASSTFAFQFVISKWSWLLYIPLFTIATAVNAAVIYAQTPPPPYSQLVSRQSTVMVADDFVLTSDQTIKSVAWLGSYYSFTSSTPSIPSIDDFVINFYSDASGVGTLIQSFTIGNNVIRTDSGNAAGRNELFDFSANLAGGIDLASGNYWISIFYPDGSDGHGFYWAGGNSFNPGVDPGSGNDMHSFDGGSSWSADSAKADLYFSLSDTAVSSVPLPPTVYLFCIGLLSIIGIASCTKTA